MKKDRSKHEVNLAKVFRTGGYLLPIDDSEVEAFENNIKAEKNKPSDWDNPLDIIARGKLKKVNLSKSMPDDAAIQNLSMAAREGRIISESIRKKMNEDRKNSEK